MSSSHAARERATGSGRGGMCCGLSLLNSTFAMRISFQTGQVAQQLCGQVSRVRMQREQWRQLTHLPGRRHVLVEHLHPPGADDRCRRTHRRARRVATLRELPRRRKTRTRPGCSGGGATRARTCGCRSGRGSPPEATRLAWAATRTMSSSGTPKRGWGRWIAQARCPPISTCQRPSSCGTVCAKR